MSKRSNLDVKKLNKRLDRRRAKEIASLLSERYSIKDNKVIVEFLSMYIDCESTAKKFVQYYKVDKGETTSVAFESLSIVEIEKAAKYFGLDIEKSTISCIFKGSTGKRNSKSSRQLRNGIMHEKAVNDLTEIESRFNKLKSDMQIWIKITKELIQPRI